MQTDDAPSSGNRAKPQNGIATMKIGIYTATPDTDYWSVDQYLVVA